MKITKSVSKNSLTYYLSKSVRINGKSTTITIERIGSAEEVRQRAGDVDVELWLKQYARERTAQEKAENAEIVLRYSPAKQIEKGQQAIVNVGYLFLQDIYYQLGLQKICREITKKYQFTYDLNSVLSCLIYARVIYPGSRAATHELSKRFLEAPGCELQHLYRGLEILCREDDLIQAKLFRNSEKVVLRKKEILYYDCTNYYFETEEEDDFRKYGISKEHRPNPIVQMGLFMDADGIPLSFSIFNGNENEQQSLKPLERKIISEYGLDEFVVCTDGGLGSLENRRFNDRFGRKFITTQSLKKLKGFLKEFALGRDGWRLAGSDKTYHLDEIDEEFFKDAVFYKDRWINENGLEQRLIVTYSVKRKNYQRWIRNKQIEKAESAIRSGETHSPGQSSYKRLIHTRYCTSEGEAAETSIRRLAVEKIEHEERFDGFYAVCTNLDVNPAHIIQINHNRWQIENCFRLMKSELKARPVYLSRKDRITAHFQSCFLALVIFKILQLKLKNRFTSEEIIAALRDMNMKIVPGQGFIPLYMRTDLTDALHDAFGFRTDRQIVSAAQMKSICAKTKR